MQGLAEWFNANEGVGTWVGGIGTAAAFLWAVWLYRRAQIRAIRQQASQVALIVESHLRDHDGPPHHEMRIHRFAWKIRNGSDQVITQVTVGFGNEKAAKTSQDTRDMIVRGIGERRTIEPHSAVVDQATETVSHPDAVMWIEFRDADGRGWRRTEDGRLQRRRRPWPLEYPYS